MEEIILKENQELLKKQLAFAKIRTLLLAVITVVFCVMSISVMAKMQQLGTMAQSMDTIAGKLEQVDVEQLNTSIAEFGDKVSALDTETANETISNLNAVSENMKQVGDTLSGLSEDIKNMFRP